MQHLDCIPVVHVGMPSAVRGSSLRLEIQHSEPLLPLSQLNDRYQTCQQATGQISSAYAVPFVYQILSISGRSQRGIAGVLAERSQSIVVEKA